MMHVTDHPFGISVEGIPISAATLPGVFENISTTYLELTWLRPKIDDLTSKLF
jgi:hypothetical protein